MKRPILIAVIGYIIGIIVGLYLKISIVFLYVPIIILWLIYVYLKKAKRKFKMFSIKRYSRYLRIYLTKQSIFLIIIISILSNIIVLYNNNKYEKIYKDLSLKEKVKFSGIVISNKEEKSYSNKYKIKIYYNKMFIKLYLTTNKDINLDYGDKIIIEGKYIIPEKRKNYKGFDYSEYLKQLKIYGTIKAEIIEIVDKNNGNIFLDAFNKINLKIKDGANKSLNEDEAYIFNGLILGDTKQIEKEIKNNFSNAGISHILAVSGIHVMYITQGINLIFNKILGKRKTYFITIVILFCYICISDFSPSIIRAGVMGILMLIAKLLYRRNDTITSMSISLLLILIYNPYLIQSLSVQLSYIATLGIILLNKYILKMINKIKFKDIISVSLSVQMSIMPIILFHLNTFNIYFLISNILLSIVIAPIIIISFIFSIFMLINIDLANIVSIFINIGVKILIIISKIGNLPLSKIYFSTPNIIGILFYYLIVFLLFNVYILYHSKNINNTQKRIRNLIALLKFKIRQYRIKIVVILTVISILIGIITIMPKDLKIYFVDVGQGDCTFVVTPKNKTILIDGGGNSFSDFDVGEKTLLPYILDRGFTDIDFMIISHFDDDHFGGLIAIMKELKVKNIIIGRQFEDSENYQEFIKIVNEKKIKVNVAEASQRINIENNLYLDILWPSSNNIVRENILNNNSLVCKLVYKNFSMLFTGDIEETAEKEILEKYKDNSNLLRATVLKVAHHGSKTSSIEDFVKTVKPKIALIGVGEDNKFGHPNNEVIKRLENLRYENISYRSNGRSFNNSK